MLRAQTSQLTKVIQLPFRQKISRPGSSREEDRCKGSGGVHQQPNESDATVDASASSACAASLEAQEAPEKEAQGKQSQETKQEWKGENGSGEFGFKYKGPEPTMFGDWAHKGRVSDF
ncbi:hypothetical protein cyc_06756 [Cyclospora cayetanensis]|uniref:Uncharacterized protein n=1 Tax=Cyclospora cayetanensis TaxID=88456 RepID=A0A1D3CS67_9EIME|nr:hypothetical protein cyc_06756 [Cyclospora cayetanensis]